MTTALRPSTSPPTAADFSAARLDASRVQAVSPVGTRSVQRRPVTNFLKAAVALGAVWVAGHAVGKLVDNKASFDIDPGQNVATSVHPAPSVRSDRVDRLVRQVQSMKAPSPHRLVGRFSLSPENVVQAAIDAAPGDGHTDLIQKFQRTGLRDFESAFQALSLQAEGMELSAYNASESRSASNLTIGVGYHIPSNVRLLGKEKVMEEFRRAGISEKDGQDLLSGEKTRMERVSITPEQALSLLAVTMPRYKEAVVGRIGQANWDRLGRLAGPEGQAGVVWSAYNGAFWQHADETVAAIRSGDRLAIAQSIRGTAKINGKSQENHNLSLARAAVASRETFDYAVGYGNRARADARVDALVEKVRPVIPATPKPLRSDPSSAEGSMDSSLPREPGRVATRFGGQPKYDPEHDPLQQPQEVVSVSRTRMNVDAFQVEQPQGGVAPKPVATTVFRR